MSDGHGAEPVDPLLGRSGRDDGTVLTPDRPSGRRDRRRRRREDEWVDDWADQGWEDEYWDEVLEDERAARPGGHLKWVLLTVLALILIAAAIGASVVVWVLRQVNPPGVPGDPVVVAIDEGASVSEITDRLQQLGIITNAGVFRWYVESKNVDAFRAGYYSVRPHDSMGEVIKALQTPPAQAVFKVTFPEGFDLDKVAARLQEKVPELDAQRFLEAAASGEVRSRYQPEGVTNLEGMLFPDTYQVGGAENERDVLTKMVRQMDQVGQQLGIDSAYDNVGVNQYEVLIIASLIEKEAKVPQDRAKIARVVYNRLAAEMPLQIDATVAYANDGAVPTRQLIEDTDSPYNTYKHPGLPPAPIALPGRASIEAALNPEPNPPEGPWLYYVVIDDTGAHAFAQTYDQHLANIRRAQETGVR